MKKVRIDAIKLRKQGHSYNEITKTLGVPKSTLSGWLRDISLTENAQLRLKSRVREGLYNGLVKRNKLQTKRAQERAKELQKEAACRITKISNHELLLIGVALYWGEGYKKLQVRNGREITSHQISFTNADPKMIEWFISFLQKILDVKNDELVIVMRLYKHINEKVARDYWKIATGLSDSNFRSTTWLVSGASKRKRPQDSLPYGTLQVNVYSTEKFHTLMGYIEGLKKFI